MMKIAAMSISYYLMRQFQSKNEANTAERARAAEMEVAVELLALSGVEVVEPPPLVVEELLALPVAVVPFPITPATYGMLFRVAAYSIRMSVNFRNTSKQNQTHGRPIQHRSNRPK